MSAAVLLSLLWANPIRHQTLLVPRLLLTPGQVPADGYALATLNIESGSSEQPQISVLDNSHAATVQSVISTSTGWEAKLRAGVQPGLVTLRVEVPGAPPAFTTLATTLQPGDSAGDGTPDFLRLDDPQDQAAFRHWFTFLAEVQYFQTPTTRPAEIVDCAALIRYAYREALRPHTSSWAADARLPLVPPFEVLTRYQYPFTPLGAALFRIREGSFQPADIDDGTFAQFADAQTLQQFNTHLVDRNLAHAVPGDLLFFRQDSEHMPFHSMIYLGESQITNDTARYVVYHTGPDGVDPGEIRRLSLPELLRFPEPQWRPIDANRNFLGVFRWNILKEAL